MTQSLSDQDFSIIHDECQRYKETHEHIMAEMHNKQNQFADNNQYAREITTQIVGTTRLEDKVALQSEENVAHGLVKLRQHLSSDLSELAQAPYFARIIFQEGEKKIEFFLGLKSFAERRIVDWRRAPLATLYYNHEEGEDYEDEIAGVERKGTIILKRGYSGKNADLGTIDLKELSYVQHRGVWNKQGRVKTQPFALKDKQAIKNWLATHKQNLPLPETTGYLRQILALLSPDQFELISQQTEKPLMILGSAGTGKTTVALHRLAWLLHEDHSPYNASQAVILTKTKTLAMYVSHLLPSLGIAGVEILTFEMLAKKALNLPNLQIIEKIWDATAFVSSIKFCRELQEFLQLDLLESYFQNLRDHNIFSKRNEVLRKYSLASVTGIFLDDMAPLLLLALRRNEIHLPTDLVSPKLLLVDEAQDFSVAEAFFVEQWADSLSALILAGDFGQSLYHTDKTFGTISAQNSIELVTAYRSTYQIYELAEAVRNPDIKNEDLKFNPKFGPEPVLFCCMSETESVQVATNWIESCTAENPSQLMAIICKSQKKATDAFLALQKAGFNGLRLGTSNNFEFIYGIVVCDVAAAKGLEFQSVLLMDVSSKNYSASELDRNFLYTAITRAMYKLDLTVVEEASPLLPDFINRAVATSNSQDDVRLPSAFDEPEDLISGEFLDNEEPE